MNKKNGVFCDTYGMYGALSLAVEPRFSEVFIRKSLSGFIRLVSNPRSSNNLIEAIKCKCKRPILHKNEQTARFRDFCLK
jgi:hypothetical protein